MGAGVVAAVEARVAEAVVGVGGGLREGEVVEGGEAIS